MNNAETVEDTHKEQTKEDHMAGAAAPHPVGVGVGTALGGALAGSLAGAVAGPIGATIGAVVGGVAGGFGGKVVADSMDPRVELAYWETNYCLQNYYEPNLPYSEYQPAYMLAIDGFRPNFSFEECEADLRQRWETENPNRKLRWENARQVMQDAWQRRLLNMSDLASAIK